MNDDFEPGAIIRLNFFFRPEIETDKKTGKPKIVSQTGNGKPRNGLVVMRDNNRLSIIPITHNMVSTKNDRLLKLPNKLLRDTEKLHSREPSYLLCDQLNVIEAMHHNVFATSKGRHHGNPRIYGIADYKTLKQAQGLLANVLLEDRAYEQKHKGGLNPTDHQEQRLYRVSKPLWRYIHPNHIQRERELNHTISLTIAQSSKSRSNQRRARIEAAAQRINSQDTMASKHENRDNAPSKDKSNGPSRGWER